MTAGSRLAIGLMLGMLLAGGCVDSHSRTLEAASNQRIATSTTIAEDVARLLRVGVAASTARGNTVAVLDASLDAGEVTALIEACAGTMASTEVGVSLAFFALQLTDGSTIAPSAPADAPRPALRTQQLRAGRCTVGWLAFEVGDGGSPHPEYLLFGSRSSATAWDLTRIR